MRDVALRGLVLKADGFVYGVQHTNLGLRAEYLIQLLAMIAKC